MLGGAGIGKNTFVRHPRVRVRSQWAATYIDADAAAAKFNADAEASNCSTTTSATSATITAQGQAQGRHHRNKIRIEHKGINAYHVKNTALRIYSSNEIAALPIDLDDRRFLVLDVSHARQNDSEYYTALRQAAHRRTNWRRSSTTRSPPISRRSISTGGLRTRRRPAPSSLPRRPRPKTTICSNFSNRAARSGTWAGPRSRGSSTRPI